MARLGRRQPNRPIILHAKAPLEVPQQVAGLRLWLAADKITGLSGGAAVSTWADASGLGNDATQTTGAAQPTYQTAVVNGLPVVRFDITGTADWMNLATADFLAATNAIGAIAFFAVVKMSATDATTRDYLSISTPTGANARFKAGQRAPAANTWGMTVRRADTDGAASLEAGTSDTSWHVHSAIIDYVNGDGFLNLDGTQIGSNLALTTSGTTSATNSIASAVGARGDGLGEFWPGDIAELIVYVGANKIADADRDLVTNYLLTKYAITTGTNYTQTVTDPEGLLDSQTQAASYAQTTTDPEGALDGAAQAATFTQTATDPAGILDTSSASFVLSQTITDPVGLLDAASQTATLIRSQTDPEGLLDTASQAASFTQALTDPEGLLDGVTYDKGVLLTLTDPVGITDGGIATSAQLTLTDPLGLLDAANQITTATRSQTDPEGVLDSQSQSLSGSQSQTITDPVGLVDSSPQAASSTQTATDPIGLLDVKGEQLDRPLTDPVGLLDSQARLAAATPTVTDPVGLLDAASQSLAAAQATTDPVGITDSRTQDATGPSGQTHINPIGITDLIIYTLVNVAPRWVEAASTASGLVEGTGITGGIVEGASFSVVVIEGSSSL